MAQVKVLVDNMIEKELWLLCFKYMGDSYRIEVDSSVGCHKGQA